MDSNELTVHRDEDYFNVISHLDAKEVHYQAIIIFFQVICKFILWKFALWQILPGILDLHLTQFIFFLQTLVALLRIDLPDFAFVAYYVLWACGLFVSMHNAFVNVASWGEGWPNIELLRGGVSCNCGNPL